MPPRFVLSSPAPTLGCACLFICAAGCMPKTGDTWLNNGFNSGDAGRGRDGGALDGDEEESTGISDRLMDEHISGLEEKPDLMELLFTIDLTEHPTLDSLGNFDDYEPTDSTREFDVGVSDSAEDSADDLQNHTVKNVYVTMVYFYSKDLDRSTGRFNHSL
ncbi:expressed unknown protein [Seminavis robusta]|uniref:Uncharacterized protein n=1 Tax=Seminavis robusta TaxID=568900 RepID=A0A9N8E4G6_9STRA|nr:expressed unknown protein [Seminavis robusta]|eukprot:Sro655_g182320.1 n/a (161) ;mRNA; r:43048-44067